MCSIIITKFSLLHSGNVCLYMYACVYIYMYVCMYAYMYVCMYVCMYICMYVCCMYICMYIHMYIRTYICTYKICAYNIIACNGLLFLLQDKKFLNFGGICEFPTIRFVQELPCRSNCENPLDDSTFVKYVLAL